MKKTLIPMIFLLAFVVLCAGCGKTTDDNLSASGSVSTTFEVPTATPEPTAISTPEATAEPTATPIPSPTARPTATATADNSSNNNNSSSGGGTTSDNNTDTRTPFEIASSLVGSSVSDLYGAVGYPSSSSYSESCLTDNGEDGWLYYDGFTVTTVKYNASGSEIIMSVY